MTERAFPKARTEGLVVQSMADETLVYDLDANIAHCLNETSTFVWQQCNGERSVREIGHVVEDRYGFAGHADLVGLALSQLSERKLIVNTNGAPIPLLDRRQVIKRIGLSSLIALPVIASLVTPASATVASSCTCANPGSCITQTTCPSQVNCNGSHICAP